MVKVHKSLNRGISTNHTPGGAGYETTQKEIRFVKKDLENEFIINLNWYPKLTRFRKIFLFVYLV